MGSRRDSCAAHFTGARLRRSLARDMVTSWFQRGFVLSRTQATTTRRPSRCGSAARPGAGGSVAGPARRTTPRSGRAGRSHPRATLGSPSRPPERTVRSVSARAPRRARRTDTPPSHTRRARARAPTRRRAAPPPVRPVGRSAARAACPIVYSVASVTASYRSRWPCSAAAPGHSPAGSTAPSPTSTSRAPRSNAARARPTTFGSIARWLTESRPSCGAAAPAT